MVYGYIKPGWEQNYFVPPGLPEGSTFDDQVAALGKLIRNLFVAHTQARQIIKAARPDAWVGANPLLLGLPVWLQRLINWNATRVKGEADLNKNVRRYVARQLHTAATAQGVNPLRAWWNSVVQQYSILSTVAASNWWHLGMAGRLPGQVKIVHDGRSPSQQFVDRRGDERATEFDDHLLNVPHRVFVARIQCTTDRAVMCKSRLAPRTGDDRIMRQRVWPFIQVLQVLHATQDARQKFDQLGLRSKAACLLLNRHAHQPINHTLLFEKFTKGDQHPMLGIGQWPIRNRSVHGQFLRPRCDSLRLTSCKIASDSTIRLLVAQKLR